MTTNDELSAKLADEIGPVTWADLTPHVARDAVILVHPAVPLEMAAVAVAKDDAGRVSGWMKSGALARPTDAQRAAWDDTPEMPFTCVIVAPFVLIQRALA